MSPIDINMFNDPFEKEIISLNIQLDKVRNIREYDEINKRIELLKQQRNNICNETLFNIIQYTIKTNNLTKIGSIEYYIPKPDYYIPQLVKLYQYYGYDGYECDGIYTIFNFDKLNKYLINVDTTNYNLHEAFDISSLKSQKTLHPDFWKNDVLDSRVRLKLLDIADDFTDFLNIDWVKPEDITMTGSLANYNWSEEYSDIDLHIVVDFSQVDENLKLLKEYFNSKKTNWNIDHDTILIYGYPVELYVQDVNEEHVSSGVYSLEKDEWIIEPDPENVSTDGVDFDVVKKIVASFTNKVDEICEMFENESDDYMLSLIHNMGKIVLKAIKDCRQQGFEKDGKEMNEGNLVFKALRRNETIQKLYDILHGTYDKMNSLM